MQETQKNAVQSQDQENLLEEEMATHSSILVWKISWQEEPDGLQSIGSQRIGHGWVHTSLPAWSQKLWPSFHCKVACMSSSLESGWLFIYLFGSVQLSHSVQFSSVQLFSCVWLFATPWTAAHQASLSITNSWSLPRLRFIESVMPSNHHNQPLVNRTQKKWHVQFWGPRFL